MSSAAPEGIYRRVSVRLWTDDKVCRLSRLQPSGQALWLYLLTGPQTTALPGVFVAGRAALAEALEWEIEDFDRCLKELQELGLVQFDKASRLWFIPNAIRHNPPANPNVVLSWRTVWPLLPEVPMRDGIAAAYREALGRFTESFVKAFDQVVNGGPSKPSSKASEKPSGNGSGTHSPKQEQEQEAGTEGRKQEQQQEKATPRGRATPAIECPADVSPQVWSDWVQLRKAKRSPATASAVDGARAEAAKAGMSLEEFLREWCMRGSQGLKAEWLTHAGRQPTGRKGQEQIRQENHAIARAWLANPGGFASKDYSAGVGDDGLIPG